MPPAPAFAALAILALAACSPAADEDDPGPVRDEIVAEPDRAGKTPADRPRPALRSPVGDHGEALPLPPTSGERRYVGRWAASADMCRSGAWVFEPDGLETAGEVSCDFTDVSEAPGGYEIAARCTAEAPPENDRIRLRFAESAQAMLVEGSQTLDDVGLVYCGAR